MSIRLSILAAALACATAGSAEAAVTVYTSQSAFLLANPGTQTLDGLAALSPGIDASGTNSAQLGRVFVTSPTSLQVTPCLNGSGTCLLSTSMSPAAAVKACDDSGIPVGDPLRATCLSDVRIDDRSDQTTNLTVAGDAVGLLIEGGKAHGPVRVFYDVNGEQGEYAVGSATPGFVGFSSDQPLTITLTSNTSLFIRAIVAVPGVSPVPEPTTWAMMLTGLTLVAATARRRRRSASPSIA